MDDINRDVARVKELMAEGTDESIQKAEDIMARLPGRIAKRTKNVRRHTRLLEANRAYREGFEAE